MKTEKILVAFQHNNGFPSLIHNLRKPLHHIRTKNEHEIPVPFRKGVSELHFCTEHLLKYLLPKIDTGTAVKLSGQGVKLFEKGLTKDLLG